MRSAVIVVPRVIKFLNANPFPFTSLLVGDHQFSSKQFELFGMWDNFGD